MVNVDPIPAGSRLLDEDLAAWRTGINSKIDGGAKFKPVDTSRNNTTTLTNDPHLAGIAVEANASYTVRAEFSYTSGATPDFKYAFSAPAGTSFLGFQLLYNPAAGVAPSVMNWIACGPNGGVTGMNGAAAVVRCIVTGVITVGGTAGTFDMQWAQDVSNATNATVHAGSSLTLIKAS